MLHLQHIYATIVVIKNQVLGEVYYYEKIAKVIIRTEDFVRSPTMKIVRKKRALQ